MMPYKLAIEKSYRGCGNKKSRQELENMKNKILYFYLFDWLELQSVRTAKKSRKAPYSIYLIFYSFAVVLTSYLTCSAVFKDVVNRFQQTDFKVPFLVAFQKNVLDGHFIFSQPEFDAGRFKGVKKVKQMALKFAVNIRATYFLHCCFEQVIAGILIYVKFSRIVSKVLVNFNSSQYSFKDFLVRFYEVKKLLFLT